MFLFQDIGYPVLETLTLGLFVSPYSVTSINEYFAVQDIPDTFVQGRSSFKIFGSDFLKDGVPLKIEILDRTGKTVYTQPVKYGHSSSPQLKFI